MIEGRRIGGFLVFLDEEGLRHAVKLGAVLAISDIDCDQSAAVLQLTGGRTIVVRSPLDEVLSWMA